MVDNQAGGLLLIGQKSRLYTLCERKGWAEEACAYNEFVRFWWSGIERRASEVGPVGSQTKLDS